MRTNLIVLALTAALASAPAPQAVDLEKEKAEILRLHELDRAAHLNDSAADLVSRLAPELISVAEGKIIRQSREENPPSSPRNERAEAQWQETRNALRRDIASSD